MSQVEIYDSYWTEGGHLTQEWSPAFFEESVGILIGKNCILDYGCGMGYSYQRPLARQVGKYIGADISNAALENARSKGLLALQIRENGTVDLEDSSCDGAICSEVFEHLWDPLASAKELYRILQPGGTLVATVPNFGYFPNRIQAFFRARVPLEPESPANPYRGVHIRFFNKTLFKQMLLDAGFKEVRLYGWCGCRIWDIFSCAGPFSNFLSGLTRRLPRFTDCSFLARWFPGIFAGRLRVVAIK